MSHPPLHTRAFSEKERFELLRADFEANLSASINQREAYHSNPNSSILHQSIISDSDPLNESKKFRKSVRFQVYNAKTMDSL